MTSTSWTVDNPRCLSQLLVKIARLSNQATDDLAIPASKRTEDKATFRELGLRLVGRSDLHIEWDGLLEAVAHFDEYQQDPAACETWSDEMVRDDVSLAVFGLLYPGRAVCWRCRAQIGDGADDTPAAAWWAMAGECDRHQPADVVADPWLERVAS